MFEAHQTISLLSMAFLTLHVVLFLVNRHVPLAIIPQQPSLSSNCGLGEVTLKQNSESGSSLLRGRAGPTLVTALGLC